MRQNVVQYRLQLWLNKAPDAEDYVMFTKFIHLYILKKKKLAYFTDPSQDLFWRRGANSFLSFVAMI
jgi:hypothetical protein